jgi:hypothetical protein
MPCIMGMIMAGLLIVFNEPMARLSSHIYHRLLGTPITNTMVRRTKIAFMIYGTVFMIINAILLNGLLLDLS